DVQTNRKNRRGGECEWYRMGGLAPCTAPRRAVSCAYPIRWARGGVRPVMRHSTAKDLAQALFEEAGDALFLFDPDTDQLQDVNPMAERLSGFSRKELLAMQATYLFRFAGQGGKGRMQHAAHKTTVFHAQDGFLLRTNQDGFW